MIDTNEYGNLIPLDLARWLDAALATEGEFGSPGFAALRAIWAARAPLEPISEDITLWVSQQLKLQEHGEVTYQRLYDVDPLPDYVGGISVGEIPKWFPTWWSEVLLTRPWDERLGEALIEASLYLNSMDR